MQCRKSHLYDAQALIFSPGQAFVKISNAERPLEAYFAHHSSKEIPRSSVSGNPFFLSYFIRAFLLWDGVDHV